MLKIIALIAQTVRASDSYSAGRGFKSYWAHLILICFPLASYSQCDLELLDVDFAEGTYTVAFNNTNNCGGTGGPDGISEIQIGFQAVDPNNDCAAMNQGWTFPSGISIPDDNNHPGWIYTSTTSELSGSWTNLYTDDVDPPYYTGDTITFPMYNVYQNDCVDGFWATYLSCQMQDALQFWIDEGLSIQAVIWQISYGPTVYADDGGWAEIGPNGDGTNWGSGIYEDENFLDNWLVLGPCGEDIPVVIIDTVYIELPPDTVEYYVTDTVYVTLPLDTIEYYITDTVYVDIWYYTTDTVYQIDTVVQYVSLPPDTVYQLETVVEYVTLPADTVYYLEYVTDTVYVYNLDTISEYIVQEIWLDCKTGLPCDDQPGANECDEMSVYVPNVFTPNNDGLNDSFNAVQSNPSCWSDWSLVVYNRWGAVVFETSDPEEAWDASVNGGVSFAPDGVYVWVIEGTSVDGDYINLTGTVHIFR